jgi:hypothetical protein
VVLLAVPPAWGRSTVLNHFRTVIHDLDAPITLLASIDGSMPEGRAVRAVVLQEALMTAAMRSRLAELLDLGTAAG